MKPGLERNRSQAQLILGDFRSNREVEQHRGTPHLLTAGVFISDAAKRWSGYF